MTEPTPPIRDLAYAEVGDSEELGGLIVQMHFDKLLTEGEARVGGKASRRSRVGLALTALMTTVLDLQVLNNEDKIDDYKGQMFFGLRACADIIGSPDVETASLN